MKRYGRRNTKRVETIAMIGTSVFVLGVLTLTGVYIKHRNNQEAKDGYYVDFDALEAEMQDKISQADAGDDLDYTGSIEEYDYTKNTEVVQSGSIKKESKNEEEPAKLNENDDAETKNLVSEGMMEEPIQETTGNGVVTTIPTLTFSEEESLVWPVVGNVLINYSMDKSVYFETLDQYKYNPAIIIAATEGEQITAATDGVVSNIYESSELGNVIEMDIGDGYKITYGQLKNIVVNVGQYVSTGQMIAEAAKPTRYYSAEGCNVYFQLTKDGTPENPMNRLE